MPWVCGAGSTIILPTSSALQDHLFVILNNPKNFTGYQKNSCVLVSFSTITERPYDNTCEICPKICTHSFIRAPSFINYRYAKLQPAETICKMVEDQIGTPRETLESILVDMIRDGLRNSPHTPRYLKELDILSSKSPTDNSH